MASAAPINLGSVGSLWRYPVKSMMGEQLSAAAVLERGLLGDRAYALVDSSDGKIATAKNPRKWPTLFAFRATFLKPSGSHVRIPPVRITLPDGTFVTSEQRDINAVLSRVLSREVILAVTEPRQEAEGPSPGPGPSTAKAEEYWPDLEGLDHRDTVTDFTLPTGTFFDGATVHVLTSATLNALRDSYSQGRFEVPRFRPNIVVDLAGGEKGFIEQAWIGRTLAIGGEVRLSITGPCGRCVMTTLAQGNLPYDTGILRTAVQRNQGAVGVYAAVVRGGTIRRGDWVRLDA